YAGRLWHVQTEDSGVQSPHVFTHLFHDGTILATKRLDYDPELEAVAVQKQMQSQHKAMLRELKAGAFDEKIAKFFGQPVKGEPESTAESEAAAEIERAIATATQTEPTLPVAASGASANFATGASAANANAANAANANSANANSANAANANSANANSAN